MKTRIALVLLAVLAVPCAAAADAAAPAAPEPAVAAPPVAAPVAAAAPAPQPSVEPAVAEAVLDSPALSTPAPAVEQPLEALFLADGCSAEQFCINQPPATVSCSAPPGQTCSSSWGGCGQVTCGGVTTRCPGYCVGDHHCANYCGHFDGVCDFGCCDCG